MVLFTYPNSVISAWSSWLLILFIWKYICSLTGNICFLFVGEGEEWFHGLENKGITAASAKSRYEGKKDLEEGTEDV